MSRKFLVAFVVLLSLISLSSGAFAVCGDGVCSGETCGFCPQDCGLCANGAWCDSGGDCLSGYCNAFCQSNPWIGEVFDCGDDICQYSETCAGCPADCGTCPQDVCYYDSHCSSGTYCVNNECVEKDICGDGTCDSSESCSSCQSDCLACDGSPCRANWQCSGGYCVHAKCASSSIPCGDGYCDNGEDCSTCESDCGCGSTESCSSGGQCLTADGYYCGWNGNCAGGYCVHNKCSSKAYGENDGYCDSWNGETCLNSPSDCGCSYSETCTSDGECKTADGEYCSWGGQCAGGHCVHSVCSSQAYKDGDGYCDSWAGETCATSPQDCTCYTGTVCNPSSGQCVECYENSHCPGQKCFTKDFTCVDCITGDDCLSGQCDTDTRKCVDCLTDAHCTDRTTWTGVYTCTADHRYAVEVGSKNSGTCGYDKKCQYAGKGSSVTGKNVPGRFEDCGSRYCQEYTDYDTGKTSASCGCQIGFSACEPAGRCTEDGVLFAGEQCFCDTQCFSGFCSDENVCLDAITIALSSTKKTLNVGEEATATISVNNNLADNDMNVDIVLNIGTGVRMTGVISGADCSGNQCKISRTLPARGREDVTVELTGESAASLELTAGITYYVRDKTYSLPFPPYEEIKVIKCGDGVCEEGESFDNCCADCGCPSSEGIRVYNCEAKREGEAKTCVGAINAGFIAFILIILGIGGAGVAGFKFRYKYKESREEKMRKARLEREKSEKSEAKERRMEERNRAKIVRALKRIERHIDPKNVPSENKLREKIKRKLGVELDEVLFEEEYLRFLDDMDAKAQELETKEKEKNIKKAETAKAKGQEANFCGECGAKVKPGETFCGECGAKIKK